MGWGKLRMRARKNAEWEMFMTSLSSESRLASQMFVLVRPRRGDLEQVEEVGLSWPRCSSTCLMSALYLFIFSL